MGRLLDRRTPTSAVAARGRAVEHGIHIGLIKPDVAVTDCIAAATAEFDRLMFLNSDKRRENQRNNLTSYVENGLRELRQYGIPTGYQEKVKIALDDVPVPIIGYIDWRFDQHRLVVDLKTT